MSRVKYSNSDVNYLGKLMRAEAVGEGVFGMQLVGNVVINRVVAPCLAFKKVNTIYGVIFQKGQFEGVQSKLFYGGSNSKERKSALNVIKYWRADPATSALYFQNPGKGKSCKKRFWGTFAGRFKNHCFYNPDNVKACNLAF